MSALLAADGYGSAEMTLWLQMASGASSEPVNILRSQHSHRGLLLSSYYSRCGRGFDDSAPLLGVDDSNLRERLCWRLPLSRFRIASEDEKVEFDFPVRVKSLIDSETLTRQDSYPFSCS